MLVFRTFPRVIFASDQIKVHNLAWNCFYFKNCGTRDSLYQDQNPLQNITGDGLVLHTIKVLKFD